MKAEELFRNVPGKHQWLHLALAGLPNDMKVKADPKTGVVEKPLMSFARVRHGRRVW
jgi:hypothetical protein